MKIHAKSKKDHCILFVLLCGAEYQLHVFMEPYFFENDNATVTVTGERYRSMITEFLIPELERQNVHHTWFQQDGATAHTARETMTLLKDCFPNRLISRFGDIPWPPRSPDLTPCDFFLWGYWTQVTSLCIKCNF